MTRTLDPKAHAQTRCRILDAARELFSLKGFHAASMNEVAGACRLTKAGLYHYFASKQAILETLHEDLWAETEAKIDALPPMQGLSQALTVMGREYLAHFGDPKHLQMLRIAFNLGASTPDLRGQSMALVKPRMDKRMLEHFGPLLPGVAEKEVKVYALQFFGSLFYYAFVLEHFCGSAELPVDRESYLSRLVEIFSKAAPRPAKGA